MDQDLHSRQLIAWYDLKDAWSTGFLAAVDADHAAALEADAELRRVQYAQLDIWYERRADTGRHLRPLHGEPDSPAGRMGCCKYHAALIADEIEAHQLNDDLDAAIDDTVRFVVSPDAPSAARLRFVAQLHGLADLFAAAPEALYPTPDHITLRRSLTPADEIDEATRAGYVLQWGREHGLSVSQVGWEFPVVIATDRDLGPQGDGWAKVLYVNQAELDRPTGKRYI